MKPETETELSVCVDCMLDHANGDVDPDRPEDLPAPWSTIDFSTYEIAMGGTHRDSCTLADRDECDCEDLGFSTSPCDGCGDWHHGDRYRFTMWER